METEQFEISSEPSYTPGAINSNIVGIWLPDDTTRTLPPPAARDS